MQSMIEGAVSRTHMTHRFLIEATEPLTEAQFAWVPGNQAPPIGWHLWHVARWADRIQAAWSGSADKPAQQIWEEEQLVYRWELDAEKLGVLQAGMSMDYEQTVILVRDVGKARHLDYARRCLAACDAAIDQLEPADFEMVRTSVKAFKVNEQGRIVAGQPGQATVGAELLFHLHHGARHLGMIEGLIGAQGLEGSASY